MKCTVLSAAEFFSNANNSVSVATSVSRPGSDFWDLLMTGGEPQGRIAVVEDLGDIVGWSRSEDWREFKTLESYVVEPFRGRGIATFAAMGLVAAGVYAGCSEVAVFTSDKMLGVARRAGLVPRLFVKRDGEWGEKEMPPSEREDACQETARL
jgi:hypothetical protein